MRGTFRHRILLAFALAPIVVATGCGGGESDQFPAEKPGRFPVEVIQSSFKPVQTVARTYDLVIAARNSGDRTIPALSATISLPGRGSTLAFAYRDRQQGLAQDQRPVWVLEEGYPKLAGTVGRGGAETANRRTFNFGAVDPGDTANMVWRVTAIKPGRYRLAWELAAGLKPGVEAVTRDDTMPKGSFPVRIGNLARLTRVDENGKVVPLSPSEQLQVKRSESSP
ncbi:MAG: hypothetical protein M9938_04000 [Solirubrobacterales bacterium]|nr:hypothetical protein [Solirubrobacterales bacterium]